MIEMIERFPRATDADVATFERRNDVELPAGYRRFLLEQNGGRPRDGEFPVPGWGVTVIDFFLGLGTGDSYDLQRHLDRLEDPRNSELLPIATDPGGSLVYVCVRGPHAGAIYFWDLETSAGNPVRVGDDFDLFIVSLKPDGTYDDYAFGMAPKPSA